MKSHRKERDERLSKIKNQMLSFPNTLQKGVAAEIEQRCVDQKRKLTPQRYIRKTSAGLQPLIQKDEAGIGKLMRIYNIINSPRTREMLGMNLQKTTVRFQNPKNPLLGTKLDTMALTKVRSILKKRGEDKTKVLNNGQDLPCNSRSNSRTVSKLRGRSHSTISGAGEFPTLAMPEEKNNKAISAFSKSQRNSAIKKKFSPQLGVPLEQRSIGILSALLSPKYHTHNNKPLIPLRPEEKKEKLINLGLRDLISSYVAKTRGGKTRGNALKINQDSHIAIRNFCSFQNCWFFGVFDGHGVNGERASDYAKNQIPANIEFLDSRYSLNDKQVWKKQIVISRLVQGKAEARNKLIVEAFEKTNEEMRDRSFNTSFSGTTSVTTILCGNRLYCANVGDSRAILASYKNLKDLKNVHLPTEYISHLKKNEKIWLTFPLSRDHKPDDEDEYTRIISAYGRVEPFRETTGEAVGPARVWLSEANIPGLAMSRSLGDRVASSVGVICQPEIFEMEIFEDDKFMILASDGLWEFIQNNEAVEMVVPFWENNDPEGACDKLIREAVLRWEQQNEVIDDITLIIVFFSFLY